MTKLDLKKASRTLYDPPRDGFTLVEVPRINFVKVDGRGDPNTVPEYVHAVQWLYAVSYGMKMASKARGSDYVVPPLEGLWWADDHAVFTAGRRDKWQWTMMIPAPDVVGKTEYEAAVAKAVKKLGEPPSTLRFEAYDEGLSVQILYVGSYADEGPTVKRLHEEFLPENGLAETGPHHEIYLGDPRRVAPSKLRTILRQPVKRK